MAKEVRKAVAKKPGIKKPVAKKPAAKKKPEAKRVSTPAIKENRKPYFVKYKVKGRLGESSGVRYFNTFNEAQDFALKVDQQKSATLVKWGSNKFKK